MGRTAELESAQARNGWLRDIEDAAYEHPSVKHACVVESSDGEVRCFVELLPGQHPSFDEINLRVKKAGPGAKPTVTILDVMPRTFSGKADRLGCRCP